MKHTTPRILALLLTLTCLFALMSCALQGGGTAESSLSTETAAGNHSDGGTDSGTDVTVPHPDGTQPEPPPEEDPSAVPAGTMALYYDFSKYADKATTVETLNELGWKILSYDAAAAGLESVTETGTCYNKGNELSMAISDGKLYCSNSMEGVGSAGGKDVFVLMADSDYMALAASQDYVIQYKMTMEAGTRYFGMSINYPYSKSGNLTPAGNGFNVTKMFLRANGKGLSACNIGSSTMMHFDQDFYDAPIISKVYNDGTKSFLKKEITVTLVSIRADSDAKIRVGDTTLGLGLSVLINGIPVSQTVSNKVFWDYFGSSTVGDVTHDCYGLAMLISLAASVSEIGVWTLDADAADPLAMPAVTDTAAYQEAVDSFWESWNKN